MRYQHCVDCDNDCDVYYSSCPECGSLALEEVWEDPDLDGVRHDPDNERGWIEWKNFSDDDK